ncbi:signal peptidase I [Clostridium sp. AF34-10BH]|jgi:signal peptidase I|uniref:signal peptidase I n=1 Tax=Clostridium sp. AF34-10BH TaxID=2293011 RepID=UPI000E536BB9|nr:signal peptidase I [Clostridium sp. AF34-10BH]RHP33105.1 signal peptidase I [Clostridium sp. AF34-10BH]
MVNLKEYFKKLRPYCIAAFGIYLIVSLFSRKLIVDGNSMEPNYHNGDVLKINSVVYLTSEPQRYDVVAVHMPSMDLIKRIIALPGETVRIDENGEVLINGKVIEDPFAKEAITQDMRGLAADTITLKDNEFFVMGDNRNASTDSRTIGPIQKKQIIGKIREKR